MTPIDKLEEALKRATPGPWHTGGIGNPDSECPFTWIYGPREHPDHQSGRQIASNVSLREAGLITLAVNSLPALLAEIRALREENRNFRLNISRSQGAIPQGGRGGAEVIEVMTEAELEKLKSIWMADKTKLAPIRNLILRLLETALQAKVAARGLGETNEDMWQANLRAKETFATLEAENAALKADREQAHQETRVALKFQADAQEERNRLGRENAALKTSLGREQAMAKNWEECAAQYGRNAEYYYDLVDQVAANLGPEVFISDDGSVQDSPVRAKIPEMVHSLARKLAAAEKVVEAARRYAPDPCADVGLSEALAAFDEAAQEAERG